MIKRLLKELLGTFILVFMGTITAALTNNVIAIAFAFGIAVIIAATVFGGDFNPAVSLAKWIKEEISLKEFGLLVVTQFSGAIIASLFIFLLLNGNNTGLGANLVDASLSSDAGVIIALVVEIVLTFIFVLTVLVAVKKEQIYPPLLIGVVLIGIVIAGFYITGTSVNPARSFAPAIFVGGRALKEVWVFIVGPLLGGTLAALVDLFLITD
ncbi:MAG: aquaporin [Acholeplasmataceae bacterium]|jgi:aquaporin Z|nr:aquaporin [Acholeplasmataceae bacterium]MDD4090279.1 aquaporin [Acholeplasmataceae bacterium]